MPVLDPPNEQMILCQEEVSFLRRSGHKILEFQKQFHFWHYWVLPCDFSGMGDLYINQVKLGKILIQVTSKELILVPLYH